MDMYTLLYLKWITNKDRELQHRELCSMLCVSLGGSGAWERTDTCICWLTLFNAHRNYHSIVNRLYPNTK